MVGTVPVLPARSSGARVLVDLRTPEATRGLYGPDYVNFSLNASEAWLERNPDTARGLARDMKRTIQWILERPPAEVLAKVPEHLRLSDPEAALEVLRVIISGLTADAEMPPGGPEVLRQFVGVSLETLRANGIGLAEVYINEFVPK